MRAKLFLNISLLVESNLCSEFTSLDPKPKAAALSWLLGAFRNLEVDELVNGFLVGTWKLRLI